MPAIKSALPPSPPPSKAAFPDPGLDALALLLAFHGSPATAADLRREEGLGDEPADATALVRAARRKGASKPTCSRSTGAGWHTSRCPPSQKCTPAI
ncbi:MAG TPA: hypothetical protein VEB64_13485 [Azospirillaceae bacterium]|nr:hypothetical protein [Azospirillaceae bacterium]